jgi:hypothetical protein
MEQLKEVIIKPVIKAKFSGISAHSKTGTSIDGAQLGKGGLYKNGLTLEEEKEYCEKLGLPTGTLSKSNASFWSTVLKLRLPNDKPYYLYLNTPLDEVKYKVLLARTDVAKNELELAKNPNAMFYIEDKESKAKIEEIAMNYLFEATEIFMNMTSEDRRGYIKLYNRRGAEDVSDTVIKSELFKNINKDPKKFIDYFKNPDIEVRIRIEDMLENGLLKKKGNFYHYQEEVIGNSVDACVAFFKDVKNQSLKLASEQDLRMAKKKGK